jgi:hypothetical protein
VWATLLRAKGGSSMELKFHYSATRAELTASESRWYVTFVMVDSAPIVHEFSSRHDVGDPIFDWRLSDQTAVIEHFEERLRAAGYHPVRSEDWLPPLAVAAWTLSPSDA